MTEYKNTSGLENLEIYRIAMELSDIAWEIFEGLPKTMQYKFGSQMVDAADSIGANIAEGFGRYHYKEAIRFYHFARGSNWEYYHWIGRCYKRNFLAKDKFDYTINLINTESVKINNFISSIRRKVGNTALEPEEHYGPYTDDNIDIQ